MPKRKPRTGKTAAEQEKPYPLGALWRDLWSFVRPYRGQLAISTLCRLTADVTNLLPWFALGKVTTFMAAWRPGAPMTDAYIWLFVFGTALLVRQTMMFFAKSIGFMAGERAAMDVRRRGMEQLMKLDIAWHERENAGNKFKRIENGADATYRFVRIWIANIIEIVVNLVGMVAIVAYSDRFVSVATALFLVIFIPLVSTMRRRAYKAAKAVNAETEKMSGAMFEAIGNVRTAKVLDMQDSLLRIVGKHISEAVSKISVRLRLYQVANWWQGTLSKLFQLGTLAYIVYGISQGRFEIGFLVMFSGFFGRLIESAMEFAEISMDLEIARNSIARLSDILNTPVIDPGTKPYPADWQVISLRNLSYSYGGRDVLRNVSFDIRRGERVGIVGLSGAGKSTLFKLLLKELEDYRGEITVDGVPLRDIRKSDFYRRAAVVLQDTEVFNYSLKQNITIASRESKGGAERLKRALDIAHVNDFVQRMPDGLDTIIGEKGVKLSGGERQRVGIARAVFKHPDVLFLDEATSHLDLESEERIRDSLHKFFMNVTAVVIAHRLTTIREMHKIVVLEGGRLIESGSFNELYTAKGRFYELWQKQKLG